MADLGNGADVLVVSAALATANADVAAAFTAAATTTNAGTANLTSSGFAVDMALAGGANGFSVTNIGGATTLTGSGQNDALVGGGGNDTLIGNGGIDTITGGAGNDSMTGGTGPDTFVFAATALLNGSDIVADFLAGSDVLNVSAFESAGAVVNITGAPALTTTAGTVYVLSGLAAGDADSAAAAAAALSAAATWTDANATAWVIVSDDDSSAIYQFDDTAAPLDGVDVGELTLVATITGTLISADISIV